MSIEELSIIEFTYITAIILLGGSFLTFARRWNNDDTEAGMGTAAWTVIFILVLIVEYFGFH